MALHSLVSKASPLAARDDVWRGDELASAEARVVATGHGALDAQLPGGGWPVGALTEVLQAVPQALVWQLLLPALALAVRSRGGRVVLVGAPQVPFAPALAAGGLPADALLWVRGDAASRCWACEQALRCADVAAVLAWLPLARAAELRRLQLAAAQHENLLFVFRPEAEGRSASPARLRLRVAPGPDAPVASASGARRDPGTPGRAGPAEARRGDDGRDPAGAAGRMDVDVLKRRGPPLASPLRLPAQGERLAALLRAAVHRDRWRREPARAAAPATPPTVAAVAVVHGLPQRPGGPSDAVDRVAMAA